MPFVEVFTREELSDAVQTLGRISSNGMTLYLGLDDPEL
jgi:hypothetical protein